MFLVYVKVRVGGVRGRETERQTQTETEREREGGNDFLNPRCGFGCSTVTICVCFVNEISFSTQNVHMKGYSVQGLPDITIIELTSNSRM